MAGAKLHHSHKVKATEAIIKNVRMAIEEFAQTNPLGSVYDRKDFKTFGPYPAYMLDGALNVNAVVENVREAVEKASPLPNDPNALANRLHRDLAGTLYGSTNVYSYVSSSLDQAADPENHDIRALYTYLKLYVPDALSSLPKDALKPLGATPEFVNPTGAGADPNDPNNPWVDVLGIHDAWGVPLNYFLYVKLEWTMSPTGTPMWVVTDRIPVVMSDGHEKEVHEAEPQGEQHELEQWILSDPLPSPVATVNNLDGSLPSEGSSQYAGWARAKAAGEEYEYVP
jgi:hypothetical protein